MRSLLRAFGRTRSSSSRPTMGAPCTSVQTRTPHLTARATIGLCVAERSATGRAAFASTRSCLAATCHPPAEGLWSPVLRPSRTGALTCGMRCLFCSRQARLSHRVPSGTRLSVLWQASTLRTREPLPLVSLLLTPSTCGLSCLGKAGSLRGPRWSWAGLGQACLRPATCRCAQTGFVCGCGVYDLVLHCRGLSDRMAGSSFAVKWDSISGRCELGALYREAGAPGSML